MSGWSLSMIETVAVLVVPASAPSVMEPNPSSTDSPSSSTVSSTAVMVKLREVCVALNATLAGTPE